MIVVKYIFVLILSFFVILLKGINPAHKWPSSCQEIFNIVHSEEILSWCYMASFKLVHTLPTATCKGLPPGLHTLKNVNTFLCTWRVITVGNLKHWMKYNIMRFFLITFHLQIPTQSTPTTTRPLLTPPRCLQGLAPLEHSIPFPRCPGSSHLYPDIRLAPPLHHHQLHLRHQ